MPGQPGNAVPIIILAVMVLFVFYVMWVIPSERLCFLGFCDFTQGTTTQPPAGNEKIIASFTVGIIGGTAEDKLGALKFSDVKVSSSAIDTTVNSEDEFLLESNFIFSGRKKFALNDFNNASDYLSIKYRMSSSVGNPSLRVIVNNIVYDDSFSNEAKEIIISPAKLLKSNEVKFICQYHGLSFWLSQSCTVRDVLISSRVYDVSSSAIEKEFEASESEQETEAVKLNFAVANADTDGELSIKINGVQLYKGAPKSGEIIEAKEGLSLDASNTLTASSGNGGSYEIPELSLEFLSGFKEKEVKTFTFDASSSKIDDNSTVFLEIKRTIVPGTIGITFYPEYKTYISKGIPVGFKGWATIDVDEDIMVKEDNTIRVFSPEGRFETGAMKIVSE